MTTKLATPRRLQILSTGVASLSYAGVLFLADLALEIGPLVNPLSVTTLMLRVGIIVYIALSPTPPQSLRMLVAVLALAIAGIPWAVLVDGFGSSAEAKAALMLPWWLAFLLATVWYEVNARLASWRPLLILLLVPLFFGFLALIYVSTVHWTK